MPRIITPEQYIQMVVAQHGNRYDYSKTEYRGMNQKITVTCIEHNQIVEIRAIGHLQGKGGGCTKCRSNLMAKAKYLTREQFVTRAKKAHGDKYDYSKLIYTGIETKMTFICSKHGEFQQTGQTHVGASGKHHGCKRCAVEKRAANQSITFDEFLIRAEMVHGHRYEYNKPADYKNIRSKVDVKCSEHGWFKHTAEVHLRGHGCQFCSNYVSPAETAWLDGLGVPFKWRQWKHFANGKQYMMDACDIKNKIVYEFYGDFWHGKPDKFDPDHINPKNQISYGELYRRTIEREAELQELGFKIVSIWESDWVNQSTHHQNQPPVIL